MIWSAIKKVWRWCSISLVCCKPLDHPQLLLPLFASVAVVCASTHSTGMWEIRIERRYLNHYCPKISTVRPFKKMQSIDLSVFQTPRQLWLPRSPFLTLAPFVRVSPRFLSFILSTWCCRAMTTKTLLEQTDVSIFLPEAVTSRKSLLHPSCRRNSVKGSTRSDFTAVIKVPAGHGARVPRSGRETPSRLFLFHRRWSTFPLLQPSPTSWMKLWVHSKGSQ